MRKNFELHISAWIILLEMKKVFLLDSHRFIFHSCRVKYFSGGLPVSHALPPVSFGGKSSLLLWYGALFSFPLIAKMSTAAIYCATGWWCSLTLVRQPSDNRQQLCFNCLLPSKRDAVCSELLASSYSNGKNTFFPVQLELWKIKVCKHRILKFIKNSERLNVYWQLKQKKLNTYKLI